MEAQFVANDVKRFAVTFFEGHICFIFERDLRTDSELLAQIKTSDDKLLCVTCEKIKTFDDLTSRCAAVTATNYHCCFTDGT